MKAENREQRTAAFARPTASQGRQRPGFRRQMSRLRVAPAQQAEVRLPRLACQAVALRRLVLLLVLVFIIDRSVHGQAIILKSGQKVDTLGLHRDGDMVLGKIQVGAGSGEVGYHLSQIGKIEFPEPRGLKTATELMTQGQPEKALAEIEPVVKFYDAFKEIPGSWWGQSALIKVSLLAALQREGEAESLAADIQKSVTDPETARRAQVRLAGALIRKRDFDKAISICDAAIKENIDPEVVANAWLNKGDALFAQKEWDAALLAYLHVPIFFPDEKLVMPAALLGSGKASARLDDKPQATRSFNDLIAAFPKSAQAAVAQTELQKLQKK
jgi:tetratricopeptide (TPR) repeat protein